MTPFSGKQKISFCKKLDKDWSNLADYFEVDEETRNRFTKGEETRGIWAWLEAREKLTALFEALDYIDRKDLVIEMNGITDDGKPSSMPNLYKGNPFPGLRAFTEKESSIFFGRELEIKELLDRLKESRFLAVIGSSGSGKSSLVRAGLLSNIKRLSGGKHWDWLRFTPGGMTELIEGKEPDPFKALAAQLGPHLETEQLTPLNIAEQLYKKCNISDIIQKYLHANPECEELILFIDQFEELFTLVNDSYRQRFIAMLDKASHCQQLRIIVTVRADFHEQCLNYPALTALINQGAWHLAPPDLSALRQMITQPAKASGIDFEEGLAEKILIDSGSDTGSLALMAFALEQLYFKCQPSNLLSCEAYQQIGGVRQAIGHHAEAIYQKLDSVAQTALNTVFSELITVDPERGVPTRRRATVAKICNTDADQRLFDVFTDARLFVTDTIKGGGNIMATDGAIVEVAHEALFTHWPLLKQWITDRFDDFCLLRQVRMEAAEWGRNYCDPANLWPHERLQKVYNMQQQLKPVLSKSVTAFIRPEIERLLEKLDNSALNHQQRERIGMRLAEIGDTRPGVGVDKNGQPSIEWCEVPPGRIELGHKAEIFDLTTIFISKYPVTFKQYHTFLEATDGYLNNRWWTDLQYEAKRLVGKFYETSGRLNSKIGKQYRKIDNHPAENVSWFDAIAFCRWLSNKQGIKIRLPTEWEWQQAATGGNLKNIYPWGKDFNTLCCNTKKSGLGRTTAVGLYLNGHSPVGALDMSGNIWEWCLNVYDKPKRSDISTNARRAVRGGSWIYDQRNARSAFRHYYSPNQRFFDVGFRVVCSSPINRITEH